jgi:hypothetical protein
MQARSFILSVLMSLAASPIPASQKETLTAAMPWTGSHSARISTTIRLTKIFIIPEPGIQFACACGRAAKWESSIIMRFFFEQYAAEIVERI